MAGHPPHIHEENVGSKTEFSFNECPSVPWTAVQHSIEALKQAKVLPASTEAELDEGRIYIIVNRPSSVPEDRRTNAYQQWAKPIRTIVHTMNVCIQARKPEEVTQRITRRLSVAA